MISAGESSAGDFSADDSSAGRVLVPHDLPAAAFVGTAAGLSVFTLGGNTMGTRWSARIAAPPNFTEKIAMAKIQSALDTIIRQMSHWDESSELSQFNRAAPGTIMHLPPEFYEVLEIAVAIAAASQGAYDPTIGRLVDLHGFGPLPPPPTAPDPAMLEHARQHSGWAALELDPVTRSARQPGGWQLDLSSIAKGYAVDLISETLLDHEVKNFMIEIGGEIRAEGIKPDRTPWWCSLENPPESQLTRTVAALCGLSVASSGDTTNRREVDGREICHLIDPRSGRPVLGNVASVSVFSRRCVMADAWATALFIAGAGAGMRLARENSLAARFVLRTPAGLVERFSPAYAAMLED